MMISTRKKIWSALVGAALALTISVTAFAAINAAQAKTIADRWVPSGTEYIMTKNDDDEFEVRYFNRETNTSYEIEISKWTETVKGVKSKLYNDRGSVNIRLNDVEIKEIVLREYPGAKIRKLKLDRDDGVHHYEVKFSAADVRGELEINPETGTIIERDLKY